MDKEDRSIIFVYLAALILYFTSVFFSDKNIHWEGVFWLSIFYAGFFFATRKSGD